MTLRDDERDRQNQGRAFRLSLTSAGVVALVVAGGCASAKSEAQPVSEPRTSPESAGEHACGNHADGACAAEADGATGNPADKATARRIDVAPGKFAEVNFQLESGDKVAATFQGPGDARVKWNVHSHGPDGGHVVHDEGTGATGNIEFTAPSDGVFSFLWINEGDAAVPMAFEVSLDGSGSVHSWVPASEG